MLARLVTKEQSKRPGRASTLFTPSLIRNVHFLEEPPDFFHRIDPRAILFMRESMPKLFDLVMPDFITVHAVFAVLRGGLV